MGFRVRVVACIVLALVPAAAADALPDRRDHEGHAAGFAVSSPLEGVVTWHATGLPPGVEMHDDGWVRGQLAYDAAGTYDVTLHGANATATWTGTFRWVVVDVNRPPAVAPPGLVFGRVGEPTRLQLVASDPDGDRLTFSAGGLPAGLALDAATGVVAGTPVSSGLAWVDVLVEDSGHDTVGAARFSFPWWIEGEPNRAPDCAAAVPGVAELWPPNGRMVAVGVAGVTDPDGDAVRIRITSIASNEDARTDGIGSGTAWLEAARAGTGVARTYEVAFSASDDAGGACSGVVRVVVPHDRR